MFTAALKIMNALTIAGAMVLADRVMTTQPSEVPPPPRAELDVAASQPAPELPPLSPAEATREYFQGVSEALDRVLVEPPATIEATTYSREARRIADLSKENVDPDVVAFASEVSVALTNAANAIEVGKQRAESRSAAVSTPSGYGAGEGAEARARADRENANSQRRQAALEERARAAEQAATFITALQEPRRQITEVMTQRYASDPATQPGERPGRQ